MMNGREATALEILIGAPIEHESERSTLRKIERLLAADGRSAIVFANFEIGGRQIDLLVALDDVVLVIETKGFTRSVRGGENGDWQVHLASGQWKDFRNPYRQTLDAALAIKNAAGALGYTDAPYVNAVLVFSPGIPQGSSAFPGNGKVSVIGEDGLGQELGKRTQGAWSVQRWREFADVHGLKRASSVCAACDARLTEAEDRLRHYGTMFRRTYSESAALVPFMCESGGAAVSTSDVVHAVAEGCAGTLLYGPSGCGKTMLAASSGVAFSEHGGVVISVQGKDFSGSARGLLEREAKLLGMPSAMQLLNDARQLSRPILLIVDGYNECREDRRGRLTRILVALAYRYEVDILVTSQFPLVRGDLLELRTFEVPTPTIETKIAIARQASESNADPQGVRNLLGAVSSGLEARLVGEVGATVTPGSSRYALFDAFARRRLGSAASDGIRVLSQVASWLSERFAFSLSIREFDRLMDATGVSAELRGLVIDRGLLTLRGDRVSFPHELFLDAFAAETVVRQAVGSAEVVLKALRAPLHVARKDLVIGAIDDDCMLEWLLPKLEDCESIRHCLEGRCGRQAREWAEEYSRRLWIRLREEAGNVRYRMDRGGVGYVEFEESSLTQWSLCDRAFFGVLPALIADGQNLENALEIIGLMDRRITEEADRLCLEIGIGRRKLRSDLFAISNVHPQRSSAAPGISMICADLDSGMFTAQNGLLGQSDNTKGAEIRQEAMGRELSPGQIHLLLTLLRGDGIPASFISRTMETHWDRAPHHLRLSLMDAAAIWCEAEDDAERAKLIAKIEEVLDGCHPRFASIVMEALRRLGALDEGAREHRTVVHERIRHCLARPTDSERQKEAWGIYSAQCDHPYSEAYCEVVASLADDEKKALLEMALRGVDEAAFFVGTLLLELASFGVRDVGECIGRWTKPPSAENRTMPQNDFYAFVAAHIALARLGCSLPVHRTANASRSVRALTACGVILYWSNRADMDEEERHEACESELAILVNDGKGVALDVLRECEGVFPQGWDLLPGDEPVVNSIVRRFPNEAATISREALSDPKIQVGYFPQWSHFDKERIISFGIGVLERYGNGSDRILLRQYASSKEHGKQAIAALKAIEERVTGISGGVGAREQSQ